MNPYKSWFLQCIDNIHVHSSCLCEDVMKMLYAGLYISTLSLINYILNETLIN